MNDFCNTFWGSHGCDLPSGHGGNHTCLIKIQLYDGTLYTEICCENDGEFYITRGVRRHESKVFSI